MSIREIVATYLKANGYDGLIDARAECGCAVDDLMSCRRAQALGCEPGYKGPCDCPGTPCKWHMFRTRGEAQWQEG